MSEHETPPSQDNRSFLLNIILSLIALGIWASFHQAQFQPYDENYGTLMGAFMLSIVTTVALGFIQWFQAGVIKSSRWVVLTFLLVASPFSVIVVAFNYKAIFGSALML
jgi:hypothetical protein